MDIDSYMNPKTVYSSYSQSYSHSKPQDRRNTLFKGQALNKSLTTVANPVNSRTFCDFTAY
jgi:hypothetical protein